MIDFRSGVPLHRQVADSLRERIRRGDWAPGAYLPREVDLAHEYAVGLDTIRKAYATLRGEGVIRRGGPGKRSSVARTEREELWMRPHTRVVLRVATAEDHGIPEGVAVAEVYHNGTFRLVRGDQHELWFE